MRLTKPVPILLTVRELNCGGIERDVTKIALGIDRSRFEPHVASYQNSGMRFDELSGAGIPILHIPFHSLKSPQALSTALKIARYIRANKIRLVHSYDASSVLVAPIARVMGVPAVLSSTVSYRALLDPRSQGQVRWTDNIVDSVVVNCEAMRRHMIDDEHMRPSRVELCYNGVDTKQFYPATPRRPEPLADASFVIGATCVLRPEKALDLLQDAFARVRHLRPGMKLALVGSGPELAKLQAHAQELGIENDSIFVPATSKVAEYLRGFDIFVMCSKSEAFSNTLLEAMACGCAAVGSRVGGTPELIGGNDERGLLFRSGDASDLAEKLAAMIQDDRLRREYGARAADFAKNELRVEIAAHRMAEIYETVLRRKATWPADETAAVPLHANREQASSDRNAEREPVSISR